MPPAQNVRMQQDVEGRVEIGNDDDDDDDDDGQT